MWKPGVKPDNRLIYIERYRSKRPHHVNGNCRWGIARNNGLNTEVKCSSIICVFWTMECSAHCHRCQMGPKHAFTENPKVTDGVICSLHLRYDYRPWINAAKHSLGKISNREGSESQFTCSVITSYLTGFESFRVVSVYDLFIKKSTLLPTEVSRSNHSRLTADERTVQPLEHTQWTPGQETTALEETRQSKVMRSKGRSDRRSSLRWISESLGSVRKW